MSTRYQPSDHVLVDAIRAVLGLAPLYEPDKISPLWDAMPFEDGCRHRHVKQNSDQQKLRAT